MSTTQNTRDLLLSQGQRLFWGRGYSNVGLREIAAAAGVDVALVSRYFGSKQGLFSATLEALDALGPSDFPDEDALTETIVHLFVTAPRDGDEPSAFNMMLVNARDPDVGEMVRKAHQEKWQNALEAVIGDSTRATLFMAAVLGFALAEKHLRLSGLGAPDGAEYAAQLRHVLRAALDYEPA
ncbi:MAG: TetR family transcriptional regulator [Pseudomonadota bacterium]